MAGSTGKGTRLLRTAGAVSFRPRAADPLLRHSSDIHQAFWKATLDLLPELIFRSDGVYCDIGCGPNTILSLIKTGTRIGVDPLMDFYKSRFILPQDITFFQDQAENLGCLPNQSADIMFSMNSIDHTENVYRAAEAFASKIRDGGYLALSVNIVSNRALHLMAEATGLYRVIDPTHPHHFATAGQLARIFSGHFTPLKTLHIQHLADQLAAEKKKYDAGQPPASQPNPAKPSLKTRIITKIHHAMNEKLTLILFRKK